MAHTAGTVFTTSFEFRGLDGVLVDGKVNADFTAKAYLSSNGSVTAPVTISPVEDQDGNYAASFTPTTGGRWKLLISCVHDGYTYRWDEDVDVDPAVPSPTYTYTTSFEFRDIDDDELVTGKVNSDFTKTAFLVSDGAITVPVTVSQVSTQSGNYAASFSPSLPGRWRVNVSSVHEGFTYRWSTEIAVDDIVDEDAEVTLVEQGGIWSEWTDPIVDEFGVPITEGAGLIDVTLIDSNGVDRSTGISIVHMGFGRYEISKTLSDTAILGPWGGTVVYSDGSLPTWDQTIDFTVVEDIETGSGGTLGEDDIDDIAAAIAALPAMVRIGLLSFAQIPMSNTNGGIIWTKRVP